jgi:hypothetical protein
MPGFVVSTGAIDNVFGPITNRQKDVNKGHGLYWKLFHLFKANKLVFSSEDYISPHVNRYSCDEGLLQTTTWRMHWGSLEPEITCLRFTFVHPSKEYCGKLLEEIKKVTEKEEQRINYVVRK